MWMLTPTNPAGTLICSSSYKGSRGEVAIVGPMSALEVIPIWLITKLALYILAVLALNTDIEWCYKMSACETLYL